MNKSVGLAFFCHMRWIGCLICLFIVGLSKDPMRYAICDIIFHQCNVYTFRRNHYDSFETLEMQHQRTEVCRWPDKQDSDGFEREGRNCSSEPINLTIKGIKDVLILIFSIFLICTGRELKLLEDQATLCSVLSGYSVWIKIVSETWASDDCNGILHLTLLHLASWHSTINLSLYRELPPRNNLVSRHEVLLSLQHHHHQ